MKKLFIFLLFSIILSSCSLIDTNTPQEDNTMSQENKIKNNLNNTSIGNIETTILLTGNTQTTTITGEETNNELPGKNIEINIKENVDEYGLLLQYREPKTDIYLSQDNKVEYTYSGQLMVEGYINIIENCQMGATMIDDNTDCIPEDKIKEVYFKIINSSYANYNKIDFIANGFVIGCQKGENIVFKGENLNQQLSEKLLNSSEKNPVKIKFSKVFIDYGFGYEQCGSPIYDIELFTSTNNELTDIGNGLSKDNKYVYFNGEKIEGIDINSFIPLANNYYLKDKNNIFVKSNPNTKDYLKYEIDKRFDASSFEIISHTGNENGFYAKDKNDYYFSRCCCDGTCDLEKIDGIDYKTFELLDYPFAKDSNNVYYGGAILDGADPDSFVILENKYAKDKNSVFQGNIKLNNIDTNSFEIIDICYSKDKNNIFVNDPCAGGSCHSDFNDIDYKSFSSLGNCYSKDINNVYYSLMKIEGADIDSFEILENGEAKDRKNKYLKGQIISNPKNKSKKNINGNNTNTGINIIITGNSEITSGNNLIEKEIHCNCIEDCWSRHGNENKIIKLKGNFPLDTKEKAQDYINQYKKDLKIENLGNCESLTGENCWSFSFGYSGVFDEDENYLGGGCTYNGELDIETGDIYEGGDLGHTIESP